MENAMFPSSPYTLDDRTWDELMELTHDAVAACFQCGECTAACPWGEIREVGFSARTHLRRAQLGLFVEDPDLWLCTTCGQCESLCPRGVEISEVIRALRSLAWRHKYPQAGFNQLLWSVYWNNNPWEQPPSYRTRWAGNEQPPIFDSRQHEILLYIGCTPSYDTRAQKIAQALVCVLQAAGVSYGTLGQAEPCSGEEARSVGHLAYFQEIAEKAAAVLEESGAHHLVTIDPHTYDIFRNHYPFTRDIQVQQYTQYLADLLQAGRLKFPEKPGESHRKITYQDPCYLARHNRETQAPRQVLEQIPGVELVEMTDCGERTLCCGGGGGRMWVDTEPGLRMSDVRARQVFETSAEILATACPYCISCLDDSLKAQGMVHMPVLDIAEIAALALES